MDTSHVVGLRDRAILATLGRVLALPWLGLVFIYMLGVSGALRNPGPVMLVFLLWHGLGVVLDVGLAARARLESVMELREMPSHADLSWLRAALDAPQKPLPS